MDDKRFLELAYDISVFSNCHKINFGAVIVDPNGEILSEGVNYVPRGIKIISEKICNLCIRKELGITSGTQIELCGAIHAEQMACINLKKKYKPKLGENKKELTLYLSMAYHGKQKYLKLEKDGKFLFPCSMCARIMWFSHIKEIKFYTIKNGKIIIYTMPIGEVLSSSLFYVLKNSNSFKK